MSLNTLESVKRTCRNTVIGKGGRNRTDVAGFGVQDTTTMPHPYGSDGRTRTGNFRINGATLLDLLNWIADWFKAIPDNPRSGTSCGPVRPPIIITELMSHNGA